MRKKTINNLDLYTMEMAELSKSLKPWELAVLLELEPYQKFADILLDNMMYYFLQEEMFEYCAVIRDEINTRKLN